MQRICINALFCSRHIWVKWNLLGAWTQQNEPARQTVLGLGPEGVTLPPSWPAPATVLYRAMLTEPHVKLIHIDADWARWEVCFLHRGGNWYFYMCHFSRLREVSSNLLGRGAWRGFNRNDSWRAKNPLSRCLTATQRSSLSPQVSAAKLEHHVFFQGLVIIVFPLCSSSDLSLSLRHTYTLYHKHKGTHSQIFQSLLFQLLCAWLQLLRRPLSSFPTWGKVSEEVWAEKRALIRINLKPISRERARERWGEKQRVGAASLLSRPTVASAAATQKQEPSNQSSSPQRLVQPARVLTHKLITSPSLNNGMAPGRARGVRMSAIVPFTPQPHPRARPFYTFSFSSPC